MSPVDGDANSQEENQAPCQEGNDGPLEALFKKRLSTVPIAIPHERSASQHKENGDSPVEYRLDKKGE